MSISIEISDTVSINVKGVINNEDGIAKPFDFGLVCRRLNADEISENLKSDGSVVDFLSMVCKDWKRVRDAEGAPEPYSEAALRRLCLIPGVASIAFRTYLAEVGAKEKN